MNNLVLFDLDHTLIACDSDTLWSNYLVDKNYVHIKDYAIKKEKYYNDYLKGNLDMKDYLKFQLKPLSKFCKNELDLMHKEFMQNYIIDNIPKSSYELVNKHINDHDDIVLVSATNEFIISPIAKLFGINNIIGISLEIKDGNYTGNFVGIPSYREGKVSRVEKWLEDNGKSLKDYKRIYCYSDSHNDIPLLSIATDPVAVNPDSKLKSHAIKNKWKIIYLY